MNIGGRTVKDEVLRYMQKLSGETHTSLEWHREQGFTGVYNFRFKERHSDNTLIGFVLDFDTMDDVFETMHYVKEKLLGKVSSVRTSANPGTVDYMLSRYIKRDVENTQLVYKHIASFNMKMPRKPVPEIKDVIFNDPATIVFWEDGTKTVVKAQGDDIFDPEKGLAMAITKKAFGNQGNYCEKIKPWLAGCETRKDEHSNTWCAYNRLYNIYLDNKATKKDLYCAILDAINYLAEDMDN